MSSLSTKESKAKFKIDHLIFRKKFNLPSRTPLFLSSYVDIECTSAESLRNKYKLFGTKSKQTANLSTLSKKYLMIKEFKDELKSLKNILNEIKKTKII